MQGVISQVYCYIPPTDMKKMSVSRWCAMPRSTKSTLPEVNRNAVSTSFPHHSLLKCVIFWAQVDTRLRPEI